MKRRTKLGDRKGPVGHERLWPASKRRVLRRAAPKEGEVALRLPDPLSVLSLDHNGNADRCAQAGRRRPAGLRPNGRTILTAARVHRTHQPVVARASRAIARADRKRRRAHGPRPVACRQRPVEPDLETHCRLCRSRLAGVIDQHHRDEEGPGRRLHDTGAVDHDACKEAVLAGYSELQIQRVLDGWCLTIASRVELLARPLAQ